MGSGNSDDGPRGRCQDPESEELCQGTSGELSADGEAEKAKELICQSYGNAIPGRGRQGVLQMVEVIAGPRKMLENQAERPCTNSVGMKLVLVPPGEFMMGSPKREMDWLRLTFRKIWREGHKQWFQDELPIHPVRITTLLHGRHGSHGRTVPRIRQGDQPQDRSGTRRRRHDFQQGGEPLGPQERYEMGFGPVADPMINR